MIKTNNFMSIRHFFALSGIFLIISITAGVSHAQRGGFPGQRDFQGRGGFPGQGGISVSTKDGVASFLGEGEIYQKEIELATDLKKVLKERCGGNRRKAALRSTTARRRAAPSRRTSLYSPRYCSVAAVRTSIVSRCRQKGRLKASNSSN